MNPDFTRTDQKPIDRYLSQGLPIYTVTNGLRPFVHDLRADEAVSDDGWLYRRGKRDCRWYVAITDRPHMGLVDDVRLIVRRDHLTIPYVEDLRWRYSQFCHTFVRGKREERVAALAAVEEPHFYKGDQRINLEVRDRQDNWTNVSEHEVKTGGDLITRIGQIGPEPGLSAGIAYHVAQEWCSARHVKMYTLKRLLGVLFDDLLVRTYGSDGLLTREGRMRKIYALVNGRTYLIHNRGNEPQSHWPEPGDTVIDVHTHALPDRFFGAHGVERTEPFSKR